MSSDGATVGPPQATSIPRFAGPATFAKLPRVTDVDSCDVAVLGVPFDNGTTFRPGARFGPTAVREASRLLRPYNPAQRVAPFTVCQVGDAGDVACTPFGIEEALATIERVYREILRDSALVVAIGGDHTVALPVLRAVRDRHGPVALVHFDAHLDTWDGYFGAPYTHGTPFRRAFEEGLLVEAASVHVGVRGPVYAATDFDDDAGMGFETVTASAVDELGWRGVVARIRERVGSHPVYVSIDVDVLDPAHAPGTGTPEVGGLSSRELLDILRGLRGLRLVGGDVVEVAPAYDHSQITALAACHAVYELVTLLALRAGDHRQD